MLDQDSILDNVGDFKFGECLFVVNFDRDS